MSVKVQVSLSDEMCERLDKCAKLLGVSRSAFCANLIGQGVFGFEKASCVMDGMATQLSSTLEDASK